MESRVAKAPDFSIHTVYLCAGKAGRSPKDGAVRGEYSKLIALCLLFLCRRCYNECFPYSSIPCHAMPMPCLAQLFEFKQIAEAC
jgi:hypothetical protein